MIEITSVILALQMLYSIVMFGLARSGASHISHLLRNIRLTVIVRTSRRKMLTVGREGNSRLLSLLGVPGR